MKPATPKTELPPSTQLRKVVFGGALKSEMNIQNANDRFLKLTEVQAPLGVSGTTLAAGASFRCVACPDMGVKKPAPMKARAGDRAGF